jgi:hypothetical protein
VITGRARKARADIIATRSHCVACDGSRAGLEVLVGAASHIRRGSCVATALACDILVAARTLCVAYDRGVTTLVVITRRARKARAQIIATHARCSA